MSQHLAYLLLGLGGGAAIAMLAIGLVVTYQASGVVNFAHAALGTYAAFAFFRFRQTGRFVWPVFGVPDLNLGGRPTVVTALLITLVVAALAGLFLALVVYRPLRTASPLARMVASLGVMLYLIEVCGKRFGPQGATALVIEPVLPTNLVRFTDDIAVYQDRLWLAGIAIVAAVALWVMMRLSPFGLATRAVAENERGAVLVGIPPDRIAALNWMLASMLAALAMILAAPVTKLLPVESSLLVVPAIAAALVGRFDNMLVAAGAALAIGMAQSDILNLRSDWGWLPDVDLQQGVPLLVILAVLTLRAGALPARGLLGQVPLPSARLPRGTTVIIAAAVAAAAAVTWWGGSQWRSAVIISAIAVITAMSVVVATGYVGQISLATTAFAGVAAFAMVKLTVEWGIGFPWAPLLAAAAATVVGVAIGVPAVRVRGVTLAMATLAAALAVEALLFQWEWFTGGIAGATVPPARLPGIDMGIQAIGDGYPRRAFGLLVVVVAACVLAFSVQFARSATMRRWIAVRDNERAARSVGINTAGVRIASFALSAFLAGIAGSLTAYQQGTLSTQTFGAFGAIVALAIVYLAGIASPLGAIVAGLMASGGVLTAALGRESSKYQFAVNGVLLVVAAVKLPEGIVGRLSAIGRRRRSD
jgi:branched-chain amino acid transport system permease protein